MVVVNALGGVSGDVGKAFDVFAKIFQLEGETLARRAPPQLHGFKVADHPQVRDFFGRNTLHVVFELLVGVAQILAARLHFDGDLPFPEEVDIFVVGAGNFDDFFALAHFHGIVNTENAQKFGHERLGIGFFPMGVFPALGKSNGVGLDVVPQQFGVLRFLLHRFPAI
ncbi:MAG: hypothetical protein FWF41_07925 [Betaproteobacteria bacterium]|nr:hypothetical protein [Betaproteobacteria bacterium]